MSLEEIIQPYLFLPQTEELRQQIEKDLKIYYKGDYTVSFHNGEVVINSKDEALLTWLAMNQ